MTFIPYSYLLVLTGGSLASGITNQLKLVGTSKVDRYDCSINCFIQAINFMDYKETVQLGQNKQKPPINLKAGADNTIPTKNVGTAHRYAIGGDAVEKSCVAKRLLY